jgi:hypothetical protein
MGFAESVEQSDDGFVARLRRDDGFVYATDARSSVEEALAVARGWLDWYMNVGSGRVESIYYIVEVPAAWAGPPTPDHRYSGLRVKIGRTKNVMERLANLRTGSAGDLIIHALEPGSSRIEAMRHREFASDRTQGEWFRCSPELAGHMIKTWHRNNALPRPHQAEVILLQERIDALLKVRELLGGAPDMVNPSLSESWEGNVLVDLAYSGWRVSTGRPLRPGGRILDPETYESDDPVAIVLFGNEPGESAADETHK